MAGIAPINRDVCEAITSRLPTVLGVIAAITFELLFLLTGSGVAPLKALLLNVSATFGALAWIFQDGHLAAFGPRLPAPWWPTCQCCCSASHLDCRWTTRCFWFAHPRGLVDVRTPKGRQR
jgi:uncharacterized membrane protein YdfJ with MMPL/SSD domain